ncbi:type II toxin-antitoxin system RelE family toxin [Kyrpidia spormannii]|uniref:Addiction module toxin, RelE/StbE family n=2 Tax=Kyrpidia spormannii TaxID=2055160 RepID=A0ACA8ZBL6_9BACL
MTSGYEVLFAKEASKVIRKLDKVTAKRILQAIESLSVNPCHHPKTKLMKGYEGQFYRLKVGNWRIIYEVIEHQLLIVIIRIGPRGDVYKKTPK